MTDSEFPASIEDSATSNEVDALEFDEASEEELQAAVALPASDHPIVDELLSIVLELADAAKDSWPAEDKQLALDAIADYATLRVIGAGTAEMAHARAAMRNIKSAAGQSAVDLLRDAVVRGLQRGLMQLTTFVLA